MRFFSDRYMARYGVKTPKQPINLQWRWSCQTIWSRSIKRGNYNCLCGIRAKDHFNLECAWRRSVPSLEDRMETFRTGQLWKRFSLTSPSPLMEIRFSGNTPIKRPQHNSYVKNWIARWTNNLTEPLHIAFPTLFKI